MLSNSALALGLLIGVTNAAPVASSANYAEQSPVPRAQVKNGTYVGVHSAQYDQDYFLGVPYAQPPTGSLRFKAPASLNESWTEEKEATEYSVACYGYGSDQWNYRVGEDCLYLNVIRPSGYENQTLPVAFWIHGGGFNQGSGVDQRYNLSYMVKNSVDIGKPIIGVSINYRLSTWGFLSGSQEIVDNGATNAGLRDQRLALEWVQENIEAFGGNKAKVTIFGESAGAASVGYHLTAYNGRDDKLFRGAIMQSGNPISYGRQGSPLDNASVYKELVARSSCTNAISPFECLQQVPEDKLNAAINSTTPNFPSTLARFGPYIDADFIADYGSKQLADGRFVKVAIMDGANADEGSSFSPRGINTTEDFYRALVNGSSPVPADFAEKILKAYPDDPSVNVIANLGDTRPGPPYGAQFRRSASYFGDYAFIAPRRQTCKTWAASSLPAYCYRFNAIPAGIPAEIGATHFQEVAFVFYNLLGTGYKPAATPPFQGKGESYSNLAKFMDASWVGFVHDLDPNAWKESAGWEGEEQDWPVYSVEEPMDFVFDVNVTSHAEPDTYRKEGMELINSNAYAVLGR